MTRIAFCDDDAALLHQMQDFLEQYRTLRGVQLELFPYTKPMELLADIEAGVRFDVLFLDVLMPGINGINVAAGDPPVRHGGADHLVTSSSEFAVQSYVVGAYYYQPCPSERTAFSALPMPFWPSAATHPAQPDPALQSGVTRITLDSLEYCEVQGRTLVLHPLDGTVIESSGSMDEWRGSWQITRAFCARTAPYLVNMEYIQNITAKSITMESLAEVPRCPTGALPPCGISIWSTPLRERRSSQTAPGILPEVLDGAAVGIFGILLSAAFCPIRWTGKSAGRWRAAPPGCWRCGDVLLWCRPHGCQVSLPAYHPSAAVYRAGAAQRAEGLAAGGSAHGLFVLSGAALGGVGR